jgi:hypothetical protein
MPFITSEARRMTDQIGPQEVGDRCFIFYREMLRAWRTSPRWTTAHQLYREIVLEPRLQDTARTDNHQRLLDEVTAAELAWQVFFALHILPYEMQKRTLNGEVDF